MNWTTKTEDKLENEPIRERIKHRSRGGIGKDFNWAHFYGFLESRVGFPIDWVIHEFVNCDWCPAQYRKASQVAEGVEMNTYKKGNKVYYFSGWSNGQERCVDDEARYFCRRERFFYVHPDTRILSVVKPAGAKANYTVRYQAERDAKVRILGDYHQIYKLNGTWYEVKAEPIAEDSLVWNKERKSPTDILLETNSSWTFRTSKHPYVKITVKRQLNSKELKHHGVKNDSQDIDGVRCEKCGGVRCSHWWQAKYDKERII